MLELANIRGYYRRSRKGVRYFVKTHDDARNDRVHESEESSPSSKNRNNHRIRRAIRRAVRDDDGGGKGTGRALNTQGDRIEGDRNKSTVNVGKQARAGLGRGSLSKEPNSSRTSDGGSSASTKLEAPSALDVKERSGENLRTNLPSLGFDTKEVISKVDKLSKNDWTKLLDAQIKKIARGAEAYRKKNLNKTGDNFSAVVARVAAKANRELLRRRRNG